MIQLEIFIEIPYNAFSQLLPHDTRKVITYRYDVERKKERKGGKKKEGKKNGSGEVPARYLGCWRRLGGGRVGIEVLMEPFVPGTIGVGTIRTKSGTASPICFPELILFISII